MKRQIIGILACLIAMPGLGVLPAAPPEPDSTKKAPIKLPMPPFPGSPPEETPATGKAPEPLTTPRSADAPKLDADKPYTVIHVVPAPGSERSNIVAVGFFNHSDRDLILEIDNREVKLNSRHYWQLKLPREFSWREKEGALQPTKIPLEADGIEIVFRK